MELNDELVIQYLDTKKFGLESVYKKKFLIIQTIDLMMPKVQQKLMLG